VKTAVSLASICLGLGGALAWLDADVPSPPIAEPRLRLELRAREAKIPWGAKPPLEVWLVNEGRVPVSLVEPGDGSAHGWRTPATEWRIGGPGEQSGPRSLLRDCGNMNPLRINEVFTISPGERRRLTAWIGSPRLAEPGEWRVRFRYRNDPQFSWRGVGSQSEAALQVVRRTASVDLLSNEVTVSVAAP